MKSLIIALLVSLLLPLSPTLSGACSGIHFNFKWKEPKTNTDGSIINLSKTTLYYSVGDIVVKKDYEPSKATGGGSKTASVTIPVKCSIRTNEIKVWVVVTNSEGNESAKSNQLNYPIPIIKSRQAAGM